MPHCRRGARELKQENGKNGYRFVDRDVHIMQPLLD
jgi:hypothetical protein